MLMHTFLCEHRLSLLIGIYLGVELLDHVVTLRNILRNCHTLSESDHTLLHSCQQFMRVPVFPHPCQLLLLICLFHYNHSSRYAVLSHCGFDWHFPIVDDIDYLFM